MARSGTKELFFSIHDPDEIDLIISFANKKSKGLNIGIKYEHDTGLTLTIRGPRDKIHLFEHQIFAYLQEIQTEEVEK